MLKALQTPGQLGKPNYKTPVEKQSGANFSTFASLRLCAFA